MEELHVCPSTLAEGFDTYSPAAQRDLFDGRQVSYILDFSSPNSENADAKDYVNYLTLNDDAHLKNFSLINRGDGEYHLSPAYDLVNTNLHLYEPRIFALDKGLFKEGMHLTDTNLVGRSHFEEFGSRIGLTERLVKRELDEFATPHPLALELIERSFLSEALKRQYWQTYDYRRVTLTFKS